MEIKGSEFRTLYTLDNTLLDSRDLGSRYKTVKFLDGQK